MRLAVSIAAWPDGPDAHSARDVTAASPLLAEVRRLGFTVLALPTGELPGAIASSLAGLEPTDTLLVHVAGVLGAAASLELWGASRMPLAAIADALAEKPCTHALVVVEAAYDGDEDALVAVEQVEAVCDALSSNAGSHTTIVAVHPARFEPRELAFSRALLEAARDVAKPDGTALVEDAYKRARERQMAGGPASGFAFLRGAAPFVLGTGLAPAPTAIRATLSSFPPPPSVPPSRALTPPPGSVRASLPARISSPGIPATAAPAPVVVAAAAPEPSIVVAELPLEPVTAPVLPVESKAPPEPTPALAPAAMSGSWVEFSDIVETPSLEVLDERLAAAAAASDYRAIVALSRERLVYLKSPDARVDELFEIGRLLVSRLHDLPEAVLTLEEARGIDASREDVLEALRRAYARLERWTEALEATLALVKRTADPRKRASLRVTASELAAGHLDDADYAIELLTSALDDDPLHEGALEALVRIRRARGELVDLEHTLAALATRIVDSGDAARAWDACQRLATLRRDDLGDAAGAVEALGLAKRLPLTELDSRAVLAEQFLAIGDEEGAIAELEGIVLTHPEQARAHARLFAVHHRAGRTDRAFLAAQVLEELGDLDAAAKEVIDANRSSAGLRARASLDDAAWDLLRADGADEVIESVFRASLRAALAAEIENRAEGPVLDPGCRQPENSTATIVRCFQWAARALSTPSPALYVLDEVAGGIAAVSAAEPTTALGPDVLRGLSTKTLAFLAGRHLTYFRPEYQVLVHFPTTEAAAGLFFAAIDLVAPGSHVPPSMAMRVSQAKHRLARHLRPQELVDLSGAVGRMEARDTKPDLLAWIRSVELTAGRAGLFLAGDLQPALAQVRAETHGLTGLDVGARRIDLLTFNVSRCLADLRATYADTTASSVRPPTVDSAVVHRGDPSLQPPQSHRPYTRLQA